MAILKKGADGKKELQTEVKTNEEWEKIMQTQGLVVVDAYAGWCGPCKAIVNIFRKIKNETGDDLLNYANAETDNIDFLENYRGRSEPTFLFYGGGELVNVIRGCNGPLINKCVLDFLHKEHEILDGNAEREVFIDKFVLENTEEEIDEKQLEEDEELVKKSTRSSSHVEVQVPKNVAVALIKPDAVQAGLVEEIIEEIKANGLEILRQEERTLTKEEAAEFYKQHEGSDHFEQLIEFMSSGPCMTLLVSKPGDDVGDNLLPEFRKLVGPLDVNMAKEEAPESLRAKYGTDSIQNAVHSCDTSESAARELAFFYPNFNVPVVERRRMKKRLQRTLALIRPNALRKKRDSILKAIEDSGFLIAMQKEVQLERAQVEELYVDHKDNDYFENLVTNMTCGPSLALCLAREDAVQVWRDMLGPKDIKLVKTEAPPEGEGDGESKGAEEGESKGSEEGESKGAEEGESKSAEAGEGEVGETSEQQEGEPAQPVENKNSITSLREKFSDPEDDINPLHGADSEEQVRREMNMFFPMETTVAVIKPETYEKPTERDMIVSKIKDAGFKISAQKDVTLTKELASMFYKEHEGKEFFENLTDYMASGPTQFLILSREDAVSGFRSLMGPTAPEEAKQVQPDSLRAQFGLDPMKNAVHGSSSVSQAINIINEYFPDVSVDENGVIIEPETADKAKDEAEVNANNKEAANGDVKAEDKPVESTEESPKEGNGEAPKKGTEEPAAEGEAKPEEGEKVAEGGAETKTEESASPEDVKISEDAPKESETQPTAEDDKKEETPKADSEAPAEDGEKKDTPSTVWDPAPGDEVATVDSHHITEEGSGPEATKTIEEPTTANDEAAKSPVPREGTERGPESTADGAAASPPVEGGEGGGKATPQPESAEDKPAAPSSEETPIPEKSNTETSREPTVDESATKTEDTLTDNEVSREPIKEAEETVEKTGDSQTETSREATITTADETSAPETSREPTGVESATKTDESSTENETSREPTEVESAIKTDESTTENETSREPTGVESATKTDETTTENETSREATIEKSETETEASKTVSGTDTAADT